MIKFILFLFLFSCAHHVEKHQVVNLKENPGSECLKSLVGVKLSPVEQFQNFFTQTSGTTANYVVTGVGYTTDVTIYASFFVALAYLCQHGGCTGDFNGMNDLYSGSIGKSAYHKTRSWRCPYVDHISMAMRQTSECLMDKGMRVEAREQLDLIETDKLLNDCASEFEQKEVEILSAKIKSKWP